MVRLRAFAQVRGAFHPPHKILQVDLHDFHGETYQLELIHVRKQERLPVGCDHWCPASTSLCALHHTEAREDHVLHVLVGHVGNNLHHGACDSHPVLHRKLAATQDVLKRDASHDEGRAQPPRAVELLHGIELLRHPVRVRADCDVVHVAPLLAQPRMPSIFTAKNSHTTMRDSLPYVRSGCFLNAHCCAVTTSPRTLSTSVNVFCPCAAGLDVWNA